MSFHCNKNHIVRTALESIPCQIKDVINALEEEMGVKLKELSINEELIKIFALLSFEPERK